MHYSKIELIVPVNYVEINICEAYMVCSVKYLNQRPEHLWLSTGLEKTYTVVRAHW